MTAGLRVEWAKARARADRWREEVTLATEEMRRCLESLRAEAEGWRKIADAFFPHAYASGASSGASCGPVAEGKAAYALERAATYEAAAVKWSMKWAAVLRKAKASSLHQHVVDFNPAAAAQNVTGPVCIELEDEDGGPLAPDLADESRGVLGEPERLATFALL